MLLRRTKQVVKLLSVKRLMSKLSALLTINLSRKKTCLCDTTSDEIILIKNEKFVSEEPALVKFSANILLTL